MKKRNFTIVFIDFEKSYDADHHRERHLKVFKDIPTMSKTDVKSVCGETEELTDAFAKEIQSVMDV